MPSRNRWSLARRHPRPFVALLVAGLLTLLGAPHASAQNSISTKLVANRCMDIPGGSRNQGAQIALWDCHGGENQQFSIQGNGQIRTAGGLCINALGGNGRDGDRIGIWPCQGGANEMWQLTSTGEIKGINGKCIDVPGGNSAAGTGLVLWSCNGGLNQRWTTGGSAASAPAPSPARSEPVVKKLYVIDGTESMEKHHNSMWHFYEQWTGPKFWQDGVNQMATNIDQSYQQALSTVCQDVRPVAQGGSGVTQVFIAGYSRGAFMAIGLANDSRKKCGAHVQYLGLVDAVNSSIYNWTNRVDPGIPVVVHLRKQAGWEHVLTTREISGAERYLAPDDVNHQTMVCNKNGNDRVWRWTRDKLIEHAKRAGGVFGPSRRETTNC